MSTNGNFLHARVCVAIAYLILDAGWSQRLAHGK